MVPNSYPGVYTLKEGIPKLGVNFFIASVPGVCKTKNKNVISPFLSRILNAETISEGEAFSSIKCRPKKIIINLHAEMSLLQSCTELIERELVSVPSMLNLQIFCTIVVCILH